MRTLAAPLAAPHRQYARRLHPIRYVLVAAATIIAGLTVATTVHAAPAASSPRFGYAYVWANLPTTANYTPSPPYNLNSTNPLVKNTVHRNGTGSYTVRLPNLGAVSGTVLVTAYGATTNYCKVVSWGPSGTAQLVNVRCFTRFGGLTDTQYTLSYTNPRAATVGYALAYVWANRPTNSNYAASPFYQFNSSGATNTISRFGTGSYVVHLPNLGVAAGHVQVTAYGPGSERCKVGSWGPSGTAQNIRVLCYRPNGTLVDTFFTLTYVRNGNVLGARLFGQPNGAYTAYAWANLPTSPSYIPSVFYRFATPPGLIRINRLGVGSYAVNPPASFAPGLGRGNVQVTAYGPGSAYCKVNVWTPAAGIRVLCFSTAGTPVDTFFDVSFVAR